MSELHLDLRDTSFLCRRGDQGHGPVRKRRHDYPGELHFFLGRGNSGQRHGHQQLVVEVSIRSSLPSTIWRSILLH